MPGHVTGRETARRLLSRPPAICLSRLPNPQGIAGFPGLTNTGLSSWYFLSGNYRNQTQGNVIVDDNATKMHGRHEFQFGGHYRYENLSALIGTTNSMGSHTFDTAATSL